MGEGVVSGDRKASGGRVLAPQSRDVRGKGHLTFILELGVNVQFQLFGYVKVIAVRPISGTSVSQCVTEAGAAP